MAANKKPRNKAYRPKPVSPLGGIGIIDARHEFQELQRPLADDQITDLAVAYRLAFAHMLDGHASEENWSVVVCSLNIALVLAEYGIGNEYIQKINDALEGAFRAKLRAGRCGKWGFDGPATTSIKDVFEIHEEQIKLASKAEIRNALHEVHHRADNGNVFTEIAA